MDFGDKQREYVKNEQKSLGSEIQTIHKITMVGAIPNYNDEAYLSKTIRHLTKLGVKIDPNFEIDIVNLNNGRDFLKEEKKTDLVIVCAVPVFFDITKDTNTQHIEVQKQWQNAIKKSGAKIISCFGNKVDRFGGEITSDTLSNNETKVILPTDNVPFMPMSILVNEIYYDKLQKPSNLTDEIENSSTIKLKKENSK